MPRPYLRLVPRVEEPPQQQALTHRNRHGQLYYLHQGTTTKGAPKYYFAKTLGRGALAELPAGFEVAESINGVVSVRRTPTEASRVPEADVQLVQGILTRIPRLARHAVERKGDAIVVYEPEGGSRGDDLARLARGLAPR